MINSLRTLEESEMDIYIGHRILELRTSMALSRTNLGKLIGVSNQQLAKYENGSNRVSASRLLLLANALDKPINYFFEGIENRENIETNNYHRRMCMEVSRNFMNIKKPIHQEAVNTLVKLLAIS